jgi:hypothetical protein
LNPSGSSAVIPEVPKARLICINVMVLKRRDAKSALAN